MIYTVMICLTLLAVGHAVRPFLQGASGSASKSAPTPSPAVEPLAGGQIEYLELDYASGKLTAEDYQDALAEIHDQSEEIRTNQQNG